MKYVSIKGNVLIFILLFFSLQQLYSQPFAIGHKQITYIDPARSNRSVPCEIYYPATTTGENTPILTGQYPLIVFGHGFVMGYDAYQCFWDSLVPKGYIMVFPTTEGSIFPTPNHLSFGLDLAFLVTKMQSEGSLSTSFFYQRLSATSAILGHSMGGKASVIASANNTGINTTVSFGMSNSNSPDAIQDYAPLVTVPAVVFSGVNDCVATPVDNQIPLYNAIGSQCKTLINVIGGSHCQFAEYNFNCNFGESTCSPSPAITREEQHETVFALLMPYLDFMLKSDPLAEIQYTNLLESSPLTTYQKNCATAILPVIDANDESIFICTPNPAREKLQIQLDHIEIPANVVIIDLSGRRILTQEVLNSANEISIESIDPGTYFISLTNNKVFKTQKLIIE